MEIHFNYVSSPAVGAFTGSISLMNRLIHLTSSSLVDMSCDWIVYDDDAKSLDPLNSLYIQAPSWNLLLFALLEVLLVSWVYGVDR